MKSCYCSIPFPDIKAVFNLASISRKQQVDRVSGDASATSPWVVGMIPADAEKVRPFNVDRRVWLSRTGTVACSNPVERLPRGQRCQHRNVNIP